MQTPLTTEMMIALDKAECIKRAMHLGFSRYYNICTGTTTDVPWGAMDWLVGFGIGAMMFALVGLIIALLIMLIRER